MKKILLLTVSALLAFGGKALAEVNYDYVESDLKMLGIINGRDSGDLALEDNLTKQESIVLLTRILGKEHEVKSIVLTDEFFVRFKDIPKDDFYAPYIKWANDNGIVNGKSESEFGYNEYVNSKVVSTMMLRALGYEEEASWENNNNPYDMAINLGILKDVNTKEYDSICRGDVFKIVHNSLLVNYKNSDVTLLDNLSKDISEKINELDSKNVDKKDELLNEKNVTEKNLVEISNKSKVSEISNTNEKLEEDLRIEKEKNLKLMVVSEEQIEVLKDKKEQEEKEKLALEQKLKELKIAKERVEALKLQRDQEERERLAEEQKLKEIAFAKEKAEALKLQRDQEEKERLIKEQKLKEIAVAKEKAEALKLQRDQEEKERLVKEQKLKEAEIAKERADVLKLQAENIKLEKDNKLENLNMNVLQEKSNVSLIEKQIPNPKVPVKTQIEKEKEKALLLATAFLNDKGEDIVLRKDIGVGITVTDDGKPDMNTKNGQAVVSKSDLENLINAYNSLKATSDVNNPDNVLDVKSAIKKLEDETNKFKSAEIYDVFDEKIGDTTIRDKVNEIKESGNDKFIIFEDAYISKAQVEEAIKQYDLENSIK